MRHLLQPVRPVRVLVERRLQEPQRRRAHLQDALRPLPCLRHQLLLRHHLVHQPHLQRVLRRVLAAEVPDLPRLLLADDAREEDRAEPGVETPHARPRLAEYRVLRRQREVADDVQHVPAADGIAVHRGDDRLRDHADDGVQLRDAKLRVAGAVLVAVLAAHLLVAAARERLVARARQDDHADVVVLPRVLERLDHLVDRQRTEGVAHLRTVDRDGRDAAALLVEDVRVRHAGSLRARPARQQAACVIPSGAQRSRGISQGAPHSFFWRSHSVPNHSCAPA